MAGSYRQCAWTLAALLLILPWAAPGAPPVPGQGADSGRTDGASAPKSDSELTGRDIYDRVLQNRFDDYIQKTVLVSGDRGGNSQESRLQMWWKRFQKDTNHNRSKVLSKTLVKYTHPFDIRFSGYLIINNDGRPNDQFVYLPSRRRVSRVNLRGEAVFGTDFSFEDIVPRELDDSEYERKPDAAVDEVPCFVVDAVPIRTVDSEYSRFRIYVERERYVPLRTRYWDNAGVEVKELKAAVDTIREFDGVYVPMKMTMRNLVLDTFTTLTLEHLEPNTGIPPKVFDLRRLESH